MPDEETPQPADPEEAGEQPEADAADASADASAPADPDASAEASDGDDDATPAAEPETAAEELAQDALKAAQAAVSSLSGAALSDEGVDAGAALSDEGVGADASGATPFAPPAITAAQQIPGAEGLDLLSDVNLHVRIELGRTRMYVEDVLKLSNGAVVELDKLAGDPVDVYVNERHVARGEVLILNDNFCVRINEIISARHFEVAAS